MAGGGVVHPDGIDELLPVGGIGIISAEDLIEYLTAGLIVCNARHDVGRGGDHVVAVCILVSDHGAGIAKGTLRLVGLFRLDIPCNYIGDHVIGDVLMPLACGIHVRV